jgi:hypothetical protein
MSALSEQPVRLTWDERPALKGGPYRVFVQNRKARSGEATGFYPDLLVRCGPAAHALYETDAQTHLDAPAAEAT